MGLKDLPDSSMAVEKFIYGKHDDAAHVGRRANVRRLAEAEQRMIDYLEGSDGEDLLGEATKMITGVQLALDPQLTKKK